MPQLSDYVPGCGPGGARIVVVGIAPGADEVKSGRPFTGPSGGILREDFHEAGVSFESEVYRTNIFKHQLPGNEFRRYKELGLDLHQAIGEVQGEISAINPNVVIGLGDPVLYSLAGKSGKHNGITVWRGSILSTGGKKLICTFHPAAQLHGEGDEGGQYKPWQKYIRKFDIARGVSQSSSPTFDLPSRLLHIANNSSDVYRFLERNKNERYCAVDIEAIECIPVCIGLSFSPYEAISIPLWNNLEVSRDNHRKKKDSYKYKLEVSTIPTNDLAYIWKLLAEFFLNPKILKIGQNFKYDEAKLNSLGFYLDKLYADIMLQGHCISPELPRGLAFLTSLHTLEPFYKSEGREFNPAKDKIKDLLLYNCKDAAVTIEIFLAQLKDMDEIEYCREHFFSFRMQLHKLYSEIDSVGFKTDELAREELIYKYCKWLIKLEKEFHGIAKEFGVTEPINIGSPQQLAVFLYETLRIPRRAGTGEEVLTSLLGNVVKDGRKRRALEIPLDWRKVNRTINNVLKSPADYDGRWKTSYFIPGTETFRTATGILEPPVRPTESGQAYHQMTKHGDIGQDIRTICVADNGYVIINMDQGQAEARVCARLSDDDEFLKLMDTVDVHGLTAARVFGGQLKDFDKKIVGYEKPERFIGKTSRHAYNLGIGKHELMVNVNTDAKKYKINASISEWKAGEILKVLNIMTPRIPAIFHAGIQNLLSQNRRIYGTKGASRYFYEDWGRDLFKEAYAFIPQQTVSDHTKFIALKIRKARRDIRIVVEAHDSLTMLVRDREADNFILELKELTKEPIRFDQCSFKREDIMIPWDYELGYDYKNLEKYRKRVA